MSIVFDAYSAYYDLLYQGKDYCGESKFIRDCLKGQGLPSGRLLELGCGTGKHAKQLAFLGYHIHGIDLSQGMIEAARLRPSSIGDGASCSFDYGDARSIRLGIGFDAVISLFHVVSYQTTKTDLLAIFATAAAHLEPGGVFLFDFWYGPAVLTELPAVRVKRLVNSELDLIRIAEPVVHHTKNIVDVNYTILTSSKSEGTYASFSEVHSMRYLFLPEIQELLAESGFSIRESLEWLSGKSLSVDSWSGMVIAVRN
jgi:SAM-dependent methyltransferase